MSADLMPFEYEGQQVRTVIEGDGPWFVAADVARILGYRMASDMTRRLDDDDRGTRSVRTPSGDQEMTIVSESGLYVAILGSQVDGAKAFKRWLTHDVLPTIRKTGSYGTPALTGPELMARALIEAQSTIASSEAARLEAERYARQLEAPASAWTHMASSAGDYLVGDAAKILSRDPAITIGRDRLFAHMAALGWIYRGKSKRAGWRAYQTQVDCGRLVEKMSSPFLNQKTGDMELPDPTIRITAKGLAELHKRLGGTAELEALAVAS